MLALQTLCGMQCLAILFLFFTASPGINACGQDAPDSSVVDTQSKAAAYSLLTACITLLCHVPQAYFIHVSDIGMCEL